MTMVAITPAIDQTHHGAIRTAVWNPGVDRSHLADIVRQVTVREIPVIG